MNKRRRVSSKKSIRVSPLRGLPDHTTLLDFLREAGKTSKADIAKAFGLKGDQRRELRELLGELVASGDLIKHSRQNYVVVGSYPKFGVADIVDRDADSNLYVRLIKADLPPVRLASSQPNETNHTPRLGDRLLVRFERLESGTVEASAIKSLGRGSQQVLGVVRAGRRDIRVEPVDRSSRETFVLRGQESRELKDGDLVLVEKKMSPKKHGSNLGKFIKLVGREDEPRAASLIAIHTHGLPTGFSSAAEAEAEAAREPTLSGRDDLREIPFVTIDPVDARDHDDAVFAQADQDPNNPGGWVIWVAIADVATYVHSGTALDSEALEKGNSIYFPDRVEPMLPHRLSNDLCSLREQEDRACLAVRMVFNKNGSKITHRFVRGLMRSSGKLTYEQVQNARDGQPDENSSIITEQILAPLWDAYHVLRKGRERRASLAIKSMEHDIKIGDDGKITSIHPHTSLDSHGLIEEMMILANVSAAETLAARNVPLIYRVHDKPSQEKLHLLSEFLGSLGIVWKKDGAIGTKDFNELLDRTSSGPYSEAVNEIVLRSQMRAEYSSVNLGHFGLNLPMYPRFTSPIRRYGDLIVHRALIRALDLGVDGLTDNDISQLEDLSEQITLSERRAAAAERDATDRYLASFLSNQVGSRFLGKITGVTRFGLFVRLSETGASGLVPISRLAEEYFSVDDRSQALIGEETGAVWSLGMDVEVRLTEATPITGGLIFEMLSGPNSSDKSMRRNAHRSAPRLRPQRKRRRRR